MLRICRQNIGFIVIEHYELGPLAEDGEDEKSLRKAAILNV